MNISQVEDVTLSGHASFGTSGTFARLSWRALSLGIAAALVLVLGVFFLSHDGSVAYTIFLIILTALSSAVLAWIYLGILLVTQIETSPIGRVTINQIYAWRVVTVNTTMDAVRGTFVREVGADESGEVQHTLVILMKDGTKIDLETGEMSHAIKRGLHLQSRCGIPYLAD